VLRMVDNIYFLTEKITIIDTDTYSKDSESQLVNMVQHTHP
jgi:hypothetical protein